MSRQSWRESLISSYAAGPLLSNSALAASILNSDVKYTFPAQYFRLGKIIHIYGMAAVSNIASPAGTVTFTLRLNGNVVYTSGAVQFSGTAHTSLPAWFDIWLTTFTDGTASNFLGQGETQSRVWNMVGGADITSYITTAPMPNTTPAVGGNFDGTVATQMDLFGQFSIANAGNNFQLQQFFLESLN